ncbi:MAG: hypothetical protein JKX97_02045 [Candidatus Lindowbacteria bacterium]|nr:hypothetical protein [Candidatus Lindowbacteria bacterium]
MVYQSLTAGAEGILYYSMSSSEPYLMPTGRKNWFLFDDPVTTKTIKELNSEIVDWSSIILDGKRLVPLARVGEAIYTLIQYKENQYLFITNPSTESQTGNIKIPHQAKNPVQRTVLNQGASVQSTSDGVLITLESAGTAVIVIGSLDTF